MIITRAEFTIIGMLIFIISVTYSNVNANEQISYNSVRRIARDTYDYNHPPSLQEYEPIPVAVVYDENIVPKGKSLVNERIQYNSDKEVSAEKNIDQVQSTYDNINVTNASEHNSQRKLILPKTRALSDFQIPVSIAYDTETRKLRSNEEIQSSTRRPVRNRLVQKKVVTPVQEMNQSATEESVTTFAVTEEQAVTQKEKPLNYKTESTHTFPKRGQGRDPVVPIIESENYVFSHSGNFHYSYEGGDGTKAFEKGELKTLDDDSIGGSVVGGFSYTDEDGNDFALSYTADENGYRPVGAHLPTPPPIPPAIARALKYLATKTPDPSDSITESYKF